MAKVTIMNEVHKGYLETAVSLGSLRDLQKYRPKSLKLMDEDGKTPVFAVMTGAAAGSISDRGVYFADETEDGKAKVVFDIPADVEKEKVSDWIMDTYGGVILKLNQIEGQLASAALSVAADKDTVKGQITIA